MWNIKQIDGFGVPSGIDPDDAYVTQELGLSQTISCVFARASEFKLHVLNQNIVHWPNILWKRWHFGKWRDQEKLRFVSTQCFDNNLIDYAVNGLKGFARAGKDPQLRCMGNVVSQEWYLLSVCVCVCASVCIDWNNRGISSQL